MPVCQCECGAKYKVPESSLGRKAKCKKCNAVFTLEDSEAPLAIAEEPGSPFDEEVAERLRRVSAPDFKPEVLPRATGPALPSISSTAISETDAKARGYFADLLASLFFVRNLGSLLTYILVSVVMILAIFFPLRMGMLALVGLAIQGWYCAFRFGVIEEAAAGKEELPDLARIDVTEDIARPLGLWLVSLGLAYLPAVIAAVVMIQIGALSLDDLEEIMTNGVAASVSGGVLAKAGVLIGLLLLGLFCWPMVVLCFALGGLSCLHRIDLMVITVAQTLPVYLLTVLLVHGVDFAIGLLPPADMFSVGNIVQRALGVYADIFAMRAIGLYYHHFKHRFAWDWG